MISPSISLIRSTLDKKGYKFFEVGVLNLNLIGIRKDKNVSNRFDDTFILAYNGPEPIIKYFPCTTDPGRYYMQNGLEKGTAVLVPGQYRGAYKLGLHQGKYEALVQAKEVQVYRDANKDGKLDYVNPEWGFFGINIHRSSPTGTSIQVDRWSAGCQVFANISDFNYLIAQVKRSLETKEYGNTFTYTLIEESDLE